MQVGGLRQPGGFTCFLPIPFTMMFGGIVFQDYAIGAVIGVWDDALLVSGSGYECALARGYVLPVGRVYFVELVGDFVGRWGGK